MMMKRTKTGRPSKDDINARKLNKCIAKCVTGFNPPEDLTVDEWADKYRYLSSESSAEPGKGSSW